MNFSLGEGIYILPSDLQLKVAVKKGFKHNLKVGNQAMAGVDLPKKSQPNL